MSLPWCGLCVAPPDQVYNNATANVQCYDVPTDLVGIWDYQVCVGARAGAGFDLVFVRSCCVTIGVDNPFLANGCVDTPSFALPTLPCSWC